MNGIKLTEAQTNALRSVDWMAERDMAWMPEGIGQISAAKAICRKGLARPVWCRHEDTGREGWGCKSTATKRDEGE